MAKEAKYTIRGKDKATPVIKKVNQAFGGLGKNVAGIGASLAAAFGGREIIRGLKETAASMDDLAKKAHAIGVSSQELDALTYAATIGGIEFGTLDSAIRRLPVALFDANKGAGETVKAFKSLGITVDDNYIKTSSLTSVLLDVADGMQNLDSNMERTGVGAKILGRSAQTLLNLFADGSEGMRAYIAEGHAYGARTEEMTYRGEQFADAQFRLNRSLRATKDAIYGAALPSLSALAEKVARVILNAVTGLDHEWRMFIGTLRTLPAELALQDIRAEEEKLTAQLRELEAAQRAATEAFRASSAPAYKSFRAIGEMTGAQRELMPKLVDNNKEIAEINKKLESLAEESDRATKQLELHKRMMENLGSSIRETNEAYDQFVKLYGKPLEPAEYNQRLLDEYNELLEKYWSAYSFIGPTLRDLGDTGEKSMGVIADSATQAGATMAGAIGNAVVYAEGALERLKGTALSVFGSILSVLARYGIGSAIGLSTPVGAAIAGVQMVAGAATGGGGESLSATIPASSGRGVVVQINSSGDIFTDPITKTRVARELAETIDGELKLRRVT